MEYISYKQSRKKQWMFAGAALASTVLSAYLVQTNTEHPIYLAIIALFWLSTTGVFLYQARNAAKEAKCPNCSTDLYEIIERLKTNQKVELKFCPNCGHEVTINAI